MWGGGCIFQTDIKKQEWWGAGVSGVVICLEQGADLHMVQLMPLPLTISCFSKIQIGFTFLVPAYLGSPGKKAVKRVCVCMWHFVVQKHALGDDDAFYCLVVFVVLQLATTMRSTAWWCSWCCSWRRRCVLLPGGVHGVAVGDDDAFYCLVVFVMLQLATTTRSTAWWCSWCRGCSSAPARRRSLASESPTSTTAPPRRSSPPTPVIGWEGNRGYVVALATGPD